MVPASKNEPKKNHTTALAVVGTGAGLALLIWYLTRTKATAGITLKISTTTGGTTNPPPGTYPELQNSQLPIIATADSANGYFFDHWLIDGTPNFANPTTITMNTSHTIEAHFTQTIINITNINAFAFTPGAQSHFLLAITNFSMFTIDQIHIRLRDPNNVFASFPVGNSYIPPYMTGPVQYGPALIGTVNILNKWSTVTNQFPLGFWANITQLNVFTTSLAPGETKNIVCGYYDPSEWHESSFVTVNPNILPGTYTCYFDITFTVTSGGTFPGAPALTIPWQVTIV